MPIRMKCLHLSLFSFGIWNCFYLCCCTGDRWSWMKKKKICCMGNQLPEMPFRTENTLHFVINFSVNMPGGTLSPALLLSYYMHIICIRDAFCSLFSVLFTELSSSWWWWFTMGRAAVNCFRFVWWLYFNIGCSVQR